MSKAVFISEVVLVLGALMGAFNYCAIAGDHQLWHDTIESSPAWSNWPDTLAIILVEFTDVKHDSFLDPNSGTMKRFKKVYTWQDFYNMLASDSSYYFSPDSEEAFGSLRDYFYNMSNGAYRLTIEILNDTTAADQPPEWYMMPSRKEYYIGLGEPVSFDTLTKHAIALATADGKKVRTSATRRICVIYAGNRRKGIGAWAYQGGDRYMAFERWKYTDEDEYKIEYWDAPLAHIGVHAHEFAHLRNLAHPSSNRWSLLGDGQKNGPGSSFGACPAPLNPWFRSLNNWVSITTITRDTINAKLVYNGTPNNYKVDLTRSDGTTESFLVENRQFTAGFDRYLPGANGGTGGPGGLLIWDIYRNNYWIDNYVDLIEADGNPENTPESLPTDIFRPDGPFPYRKIFDYSSPATLKFRDGTLSHFAVDNYTANGDTITLNFRLNYLTSNSAEATAFDNGRRLLRDSDGKYHLVYETEGQIYYQLSTDGGSTWSDYKWFMIRLRKGNNKFPSITGTSSEQFVVWQRYDTSTSTYHTYFTKNVGSEWSAPTTITYLSNLTSTTDPLPVITYKTIPGGNRLLVCAKTGSGIKYVTSDDDGRNWSAAGEVPSAGSASKSPSLSMGPNTPAGAVYLTYDDGSSVYMNSYSTGWASPENVSSGSGCTENKFASVEVDGYFGKDVAWEAKKSSNSKYVIVHKRRTTSWEPVTYFEPSSSATRYRRPSITGHGGKARSIVWHDEGGMLYRASTVNGLSWSVVVVGDTWLQHPNLSVGRVDSAKYVFTGGSASPYEVHLSGETLPPSGGLGKGLLASGEGKDGGEDSFMCAALPSGCGG